MNVEYDEYVNMNVEDDEDVVDEDDDDAENEDDENVMDEEPEEVSYWYYPNYWLYYPDNIGP
jgi:hypothetical protein